MLLEQIGITAFGNLHDLVFEPGKGINLLEAPNESGKTTFASFLKFLFFGLPKTAGKEDSSEWDRFFPWQGGSCAGYALISMNGKQYRLERSATLSGKNTRTNTAKIYEMPSGSPVDEEPGSFFLGVPETVFRRSAFVSQSDAAKLGGKELQSAIENILFSADEELNTQKALKKLNDVRILLLYKNEKGGMIYDLQNEEEALERRLADAKADEKEIAALEESFHEQNELLSQKEKRAEEAEKLLRRTDAIRRLKQIFAAKEAAKALGSAEDEWSAFFRAHAVDGILPDRDTEATLSRLESDLLREEKLRAETAKMISAEKQVDPDTLPDPMAARDTLDRCRRMQHTGKTITVWGVLLLLLGLCMGIGGGVLLYTGKPVHLTLPLLAASLLPILSGILLLAIATRKKHAAKELLSSWEADSPEELENQLTQMQKARADAMRVQAAVDAAKGQEAASAKRSAALLGEARKIAGRWGKAPETLADFPPILAGIREILAEADLLRRKLDNAQTAADTSALDYAEDEERRLLMILSDDPDRAELPPEEYNRLKTNLKFERETAETMRRKLRIAETTLTEKRARAEEPRTIAEKIITVRAEISRLRQKLAGYQLAIEKLTEASDRLRRSLSPKLSEDASRYMEAASNGSYDRLLVDEELKLRFLSDDTAHDAASFSSGTADLAYISLRLALIRLLYDEKADKLPPLIFDESFVRLDDRRLSAILKVISAYGAQVFLLTCHRREGRILQEVAPFTALALPQPADAH